MRIKTIVLLAAGVLAATGLSAPVKAAPAKAAPVVQAAQPEYQGFQAGDILVRARGVWVAPETYTTFATGAAAGGVANASQSYIPELDVSYFFTKNISAELIAAVTRHHMSVKHPNIDLGRVEVLPPTLTAQYHFLPTSMVNPYLGAGINYTTFFGTSKGASGLKVHYDSSWGPALQAGADIHLTGNWYANVDVKQLFVSTTANVGSGAATARVNLNPTLVGVGVGYKF